MALFVVAVAAISTMVFNERSSEIDLRRESIHSFSPVLDTGLAPWLT